MYKDHSNPLNVAMGQLLTGALFFAMRSCEYSSTPKQAEKKTKLLRLKNLRFFNRDKDGFMAIVPHHSTLQDLQQAECISITFDDQKNGEKDACITQHRASNGTNLCPVEAWAALVKRILAYPNTCENTTVNTFQTKGKLKQISSTQTKNFITSHVKSIGERKLGIDVKTVGTHSLRSSCAMLLYLSNVRTSTIMLLGRWKSDAFLLYLRRQVKEFTQEVTKQMGAQPDVFFTIPPEHKNTSTNRDTAAQDDPRSRHPESIASSSHFNGLSHNISTANINPLHPPTAGDCNSPPISSRSTMITAINAYHPVTTVTPSSKADHIGLTTTAHDVVTSSTFVTAVEEIVHNSLKDCVNKLTATAVTGENSYITTTNTNHETTKEAKKNRVDLLLDSFIRYKTCHDCPLSGFAAKEIFQSHVECIPIKEVETDEEEPIYMMDRIV